MIQISVEESHKTRVKQKNEGEEISMPTLWPFRTQADAVHAALAAESPEGPAVNLYYGLHCAALHAGSAVVAVSRGIKGFRQEKTARAVIQESGRRYDEILRHLQQGSEFASAESALSANALTLSRFFSWRNLRSGH
jgi:hypothetical protein